MSAALPLPPLTADEAAHSRRLVHRIWEEIDTRGGWLSFERFMEMALYEPGLGYYSAGATKLGAAGDFTTAAENSVSRVGTLTIMACLNLVAVRTRTLFSAASSADLGS